MENWLEDLQKPVSNTGATTNIWLGKKYKGKFSGQRQTKNIYERSKKNGGDCVIRSSTLVMAL
jgi:hypothetical protein